MKRLRRVLCFLGLGGDGILRLDKWDGADWAHLGSDPGPYPTGGWYLLALEGEVVAQQLNRLPTGRKCDDTSYDESH